jgi:hypothetical protein
MLGLTRTDETQELICESDPALGGEADTWRPPTGTEASDCTVLVMRALSQVQILRLVPALQGASGEEADAASMHEAFLAVCRAAFVEVREASVYTEDVAALDYLSVGQAISLGSWVLEESQPTTDPTRASA